ncbi:RNA polymerase III subunit RPC82-domain-containing protein [Lipomyces oligophaga]|uniref:RNA polymerase III subunit RPC82-domain-containing protein n=1 Tax=Lipomyces oligophaga TaxID=45792 RepID=UPI0034CD1C49
MTSQYECDFIVLIVRDFYGELAAKVLDILFKEGRLSLQLLVRYSGLSSSTITKSLVALVQNRFVLYWTPVDFNRSSLATVYSANPKLIYSTIVRSATLISYVSDEFAETSAATDVVKNLSLYGHIRTSNYLSALPQPAVEGAKEALMALLKAKIVSTLLAHEFHPISDLYQTHFEKRLAAIPRAKTLSEAKRDLQGHLEAQEDMKTLARVHDSLTDGFSAVNGQQNGALPAAQIDENCVLTINYDKFDVLLRHNLLVDLAADRVGETSALVYRQVLACMEPKLFRCRDDNHSSPVISSFEISKKISKTLDLASAIAVISSRRSRSRSRHSSRSKHDSDESASDSDSGSDKESQSESDGDYKMMDLHHKNRKRRHSSRDERRSKRSKRHHNESDSELDRSESDSASSSSSSDGPSTLELVNIHLSLLSSVGSFPFIHKIGTKGGGEWTIDFPALASRIQEFEYTQLIERRQGPIASRLLRIVRAKGRIDEKQIAQIALLPTKEIRSHLTALHEIGALDLQEVPKGSDHAPSRTYYLWFHNPQSAYSLMAQQILRAMTRCYQRMVDERRKRPGVMAKLQREDVRRNEAHLLTKAEREQVQRIRDIEQRLLTQILRLDRLVLIFRDI